MSLFFFSSSSGGGELESTSSSKCLAMSNTSCNCVTKLLFTETCQKIRSKKFPPQSIDFLVLCADLSLRDFRETSVIIKLQIGLHKYTSFIQAPG